MRGFGVGKVPYLEVLDVFDGDGVEPVEFLEEVFLEGEEDVCSVEPTEIVSTARSSKY